MSSMDDTTELDRDKLAAPVATIEVSLPWAWLRLEASLNDEIET